MSYIFAKAGFSASDYTIRSLTMEDIDAVMDLQADIADGLKREGRLTDIHLRSRAEFAKRIKPGNAVGIINKEFRLVAISLLAPPPFSDKEIAPGSHVKKLDDLYGRRRGSLWGTYNNWAIIEGVMVHPKNRGNGLPGYMFAFLESIAVQRRYGGMVSQVTIGNEGSKKAFVNAGYSVFTKTTDPTDNSEIEILHKRLTLG